VQLRQLKIENKKKGQVNLDNPLALQSLKGNVLVVRSIDIYLGFDKSFFVRGANDTEPRNHPTS